MRCLLLTAVVTLAGAAATARAETPVTPSLAVPPVMATAAGAPDSLPAAIKRTDSLNHVLLEELNEQWP